MARSVVVTMNAGLLRQVDETGSADRARASGTGTITAGRGGTVRTRGAAGPDRSPAGGLSAGGQQLAQTLDARRVRRAAVDRSVRSPVLSGRRAGPDCVMGAG